MCDGRFILTQGVKTDLHIQFDPTVWRADGEAGAVRNVWHTD